MKHYVPSALAVGLLASGAFAGVVSAQTRPDSGNPVAIHRQYPMDNQAFLQAQADLLGLSADDLKTRLADGKDFLGVAADLGFDKATLKQRLTNMRKARLEAKAAAKPANGNADKLLDAKRPRFSFERLKASVQSRVASGKISKVDAKKWAARFPKRTNDPGSKPAKRGFWGFSHAK